MIGDSPESAAAAAAAAASTGDVEVAVDAVLTATGSPVQQASVKAARMKSKTARRLSNAQQKNVLSPADDDGSASFDDEAENLDVTERLLRKVSKRPGLSDSDHEVVRLIGQHLTNIGLKTSAAVLMAEAGCKLDQPTAATFKMKVLSGDWAVAVKTLDNLRDHLENPEKLSEMKYLLLEQKYLELLSQKNRIEALKVLQTELTPLRHKQTRTHELSSYLMLSKPEDISRVTRSAGGELSRHDLMDRLQEFLPASIMLPPRRLATLIGQAAEFQIDRCLFHNKSQSPSGSYGFDSSCLAVDHHCAKTEFPCETIQVLNDHCEEVWYCQFSPDGLKLATGSKDMTVIVWEFDPETLELRHGKTLEQHAHGVAFFSWSPDSSKLAVCGPEESSEEICIWNVDTGQVEGKISHSGEDQLTSVSWSPDGAKISCGGKSGQFYQCDTKGVVLDSWEGIRVVGLHYRRDGKSVLAADTHHRIRSYNFDELSDASVLREDQGIMTFVTDSSDRYAILNVDSQGLHLWDIESRSLVRKYVGITQGHFSIYSTFGGGNGVDRPQNFIASGSEDSKVYLYHIRKEDPIAVLSGHTRTVNCVTWNPVYPNVLASASDDGTVRIWGPTERHRNRSIANGNRARNGNGVEGAGCNTTNGMS